MMQSMIPVVEPLVIPGDTVFFVLHFCLVFIFGFNTENPLPTITLNPPISNIYHHEDNLKNHILVLLGF